MKLISVESLSFQGLARVVCNGDFEDILCQIDGDDGRIHRGLPL